MQVARDEQSSPNTGERVPTRRQIRPRAAALTQLTCGNEVFYRAPEGSCC
jgi:hypothetical protein